MDDIRTRTEKKKTPAVIDDMLSYCWIVTGTMDAIQERENITPCRLMKLYDVMRMIHIISCRLTLYSVGLTFGK